MSNKLQLKLRRIVAAEGVDVEMVAVNANYSPLAALSDIANVVSDDEFAKSIPEDGGCYEIEDTGDDYNVTEIAEVPSCGEQLLMMIRAAYTALHTMQYVHWNAKGEEFDKTHYTTNDFIWRINSQIDTLAEWTVVDCGHLPHPDTFVCAEGKAQCESYDFELKADMETIFNALKSYLAALEVFYCNMSHDRQNLIDCWIREWRHECEYRMQRSMFPEICAVPAIPV